MNLPRIEITAGMHRIEAQVAASPQERQTGLMHLENAAHEGMLFVFEQPATQCFFWMVLNTLLPLTAAFVADDGTIVNLADMKPQTEDSHCSARPVRYVLEMNQGWFAQKGIKPGSKLVVRRCSTPGRVEQAINPAPWPRGFLCSGETRHEANQAKLASETSS